jgi:ribosomal protein S12 methylthiotransferase accessory factor
MIRSTVRQRFEPTPRLGPLSTRSVPLHQTESRVRTIAARIPVTRLADLTPLDDLGLPVYGAVTPLARDLTTHLGKGVDAQAARVSALMEAVERISAESWSSADALWASHAALVADSRVRALDPRAFTLPPHADFQPERRLHWGEGWDLFTGSPVLLPIDLIVSPPPDGVLREVDTNGLASGNILLEAIVHALCEVIERDAISQHEFRCLFGDPEDPMVPCQPVRLDTIEGPAAPWIERILRKGLHVVVQEISVDIAVPTFRATLVDLGYATASGSVAAHFPGYGTHPDARIAVLRAITEAIQSRLAVIQGARDAYNVAAELPRRAMRVARAAEVRTGGAIDFARIPTHPALDLRDDLDFLLEQLQVAGFHQALVFDLSREDLGIPVVRVRVPGLAMFAVNRLRVGPRELRWLLPA